MLFIWKSHLIVSFISSYLSAKEAKVLLLFWFDFLHFIILGYNLSEGKFLINRKIYWSTKDIQHSFLMHLTLLFGDWCFTYVLQIYIYNTYCVIMYSQTNLIIWTLFPRGPCISYQQQQQQQLRAEWCWEASSLRVLWTLLHQQPRVGTTCPSTWHVSTIFFPLFFFCTLSLGASCLLNRHSNLTHAFIVPLGMKAGNSDPLIVRRATNGARRHMNIICSVHLITTCKINQLSIRCALCLVLIKECLAC